MNEVSNNIICNNFVTVHFVYLLIEKQKHGLKNTVVIITAVIIINYYCCILILICSSRNEHEQ